MTVTRIAIVTDIHHGKTSHSKKGHAALPLLEQFARFAAAQGADLVLELGDRISDEDPETDRRLQAEVKSALGAVAAPIFHINGNHDRDFLTVAENAAILGQSLGLETVDIGGWRLVLWRADSLIRRPGGFFLDDADVAWLAAVVAASDRPLLIASHVPVSGHSQVGNYYFENNAGHSTYPGADRVRAVLRSATVPVAWIAGHVHWNTVTVVDGIPHFTLQSLTEGFTTAGEPSGTFGLLELAADRVGFRAHGDDAFACTLPLAQTTRRWYPPMAPFDQIPGQVERRARIARYQAEQRTDAGRAAE
ncbi:MAG: metallophosphoesterase [Alphaproteobacteria bacterium]|nr:metallophosphoesterase [Alphaproteobacteria bacterium]